MLIITIITHYYAGTQLKDAQSKGTNNPEAAVILQSMAKLKAVISGNLVDVSGKLLQCHIITSEQHSMIIDPQHQHTNLCLDTILTAIGNQIQEDGDKLEVFIKMLENMGQFYKGVCDALRKS